MLALPRHAESHKTRYYGIFVQNDNGRFWLYESGNGADQFFGAHYPTEQEIDAFRNNIVKA